jgi:hypothetical protein
VGSGGADGVLEVLRREPGRRWDHGAWAGRVDAAEAQQGVEVDGAACLKLGGVAAALYSRPDAT